MRTVQGYVIRYDNELCTRLYGRQVTKVWSKHTYEILRSNNLAMFESVEEAVASARTFPIQTGEDEVSVYWMKLQIAETKDEAWEQINNPKFPIIFLVYNTDFINEVGPEIVLLGRDGGTPYDNGDGYVLLEQTDYRPFEKKSQVQHAMMNMSRQWETAAFPATFEFERVELVHQKLGQGTLF